MIIKTFKAVNILLLPKKAGGFRNRNDQNRPYSNAHSNGNGYSNGNGVSRSYGPMPPPVKRDYANVENDDHQLFDGRSSEAKRPRSNRWDDAPSSNGSSAPSYNGSSTTIGPKFSPAGYSNGHANGHANGNGQSYGAVGYESDILASFRLAPPPPPPPSGSSTASVSQPPVINRLPTSYPSYQASSYY